MVKLNKSRIKWLVRQVVREGRNPSEVAPIYKMGVRRVQQLVKQFDDSVMMPELNKKRRPKTFLTLEQEKAIDKAYSETLLTPRLLYYELKRRGSYAPKNKIYSFMKSKGFVLAEPNKQKKRKRCRYEREHTGSLVHADYHRKSENDPHCIFWLDDASRKILSGGEFDSPNAENASCVVVDVDPAYTTRDCSFCGTRTNKLELSQRKFVCKKCNTELPRDYNSTLNIFVCGKELTTMEKPSNTCHSDKQEVSMKSEAPSVKVG